MVAAEDLPQCKAGGGQVPLREGAPPEHDRCACEMHEENGQEGSSVQGDEEKHPPVRPVSQQAEQRKGVDAWMLQERTHGKAS